MSQLDQREFDVIIRGTGLAQCILAAALARAGKQVLHVDQNAYYGAQEASFALDELVTWAKFQQQDASSAYSNIEYDFGLPPSTSVECPPELLKRSRRYALSLRPVLVPANGPFVDALVSIGVASYASFRLLETTVIYQKDSEEPFKRVPSSKEDVFKSDELNLVNKRRLMKFLTFAAGDFESSDHLKNSPKIGELLRKHFGLADPLLNVVLFAVCYCQSENDDALETLCNLRKYLRSMGRYGSSSFLVGQYGGIGEISQGFARVCAVHGGVYMLDQSTSSTQGSSNKEYPHTIDLIDQGLVTSKAVVGFEDPTSADFVQCSKAVIILNKALNLPSSAKVSLRHTDVQLSEAGDEPLQPAETACIVFPPGCMDNERPVTALMHGEGTMSCPTGQYALYLSCESSSPSRQLLEPFLHTLLAKLCQTSEGEPSSVEFSLFYNERLSDSADMSVTEYCDRALQQAQTWSRSISGTESSNLFQTSRVEEES